ncbi:hypothetical protein ACFLS5_02505 [Candidatus Bipolaricaulota bacterium]
MKAKQRKRVLWISIAGMLVVGAVVVSFLVLADSEQTTFTATAYSDVIRFAADGVGSIQIRIYDMSENELWDSGQVSTDFVDWDRTNEWGERLANGYYIYFVQGWSAADELTLAKTGKVVLLPGDQVQLQSAPTSSSSDGSAGLDSFTEEDFRLLPKGTTTNSHLTESWAFGEVAIGMTNPTRRLDINVGASPADGLRISGSDAPRIVFQNTSPSGRTWEFTTNTNGSFSIAEAMVANRLVILPNSGNVGIGTTTPAKRLVVNVGNSSGDGMLISGSDAPRIAFQNTSPSGKTWEFTTNTNGSFSIAEAMVANRLVILPNSGNVGIGTAAPTAKLEIESSAGQDLIAAYPSSSRVAGSAVFVVKSTGEVRADGAFYSGAGDCSTGGFNAGGADVAERINVSEWVEAGDVVEIDPEHVGFFRKATGPYNQRVAGIISTSPGVILGSDISPETDSWDDNRPVLAIAGRVPVKASTENGPIAVGDLLVSSSVPGGAMKGDPSLAVGAVVGKAMEPLEKGEGIIMAQVMLR